MQPSEAISDPLVDNDAGVQDTVRRGTTLWQRITLAVIIVLSIFLNFFRLGQNQFLDIGSGVNSYYAAAVKSMLMNWHNFFFAAFDPQGFLAIDKPPLGFWIQAASARIFGFSAWSLLLPEALAGVGAVIVLYVLVQRIYGANAGLIAALVLALMPISVVTSRNNTIDSVLILTLLFAAWTLSIAAETGSVRWLLITALLVGLGFNIKMLEAYLILPPFVLVYLLSVPRRLRVRMLHLVLAGIVLLIVSFSWITIVDLVPATQRPYVSSTQHDSELELALGYNGLSRVLGIGGNATSSQGGKQAAPGANTTSLLVVFGIAAVGFPGPLRLINPSLGGQIGWLLLFAFFCVIAVWRWRWPKQPLTASQQGLFLWVIWFLTLLIFFSAALFDHPYYLVTFAPAICALVGIGAVILYRAYQAQAGWRSWLLPIALLATAAVQEVMLARFPTWNHVLAPIIVGLSLLIAIVLVVARLVPRFPRNMLNSPLVVAGLLVLLIAPAIWALLPLWSGTDTIDPVAGPARPASILAIVAHAFIPESEHAQPDLEHYLLAHEGQARYLVVTMNASTAAPFILDTGKSAIALGGYNGFDPTLSVPQVATLVQQGDVRFFLLPAFAQLQLPNTPPQVVQDVKNILLPSSLHGGSIMQPEISQWVKAHCTLVPRSAVEPGTTGTSDTVSLGEGYTLPMQLFDCSSRH
ncbi:MAG TPA: glycosyltransferase family 39 protein [Ktedonobacteraceae bacterium]|nr:glycosyltransferase family 39 protein [Ktedonobacteraceae bacterium]